MAIIPPKKSYSDPDYDIKESLLHLIRGGFSFNEAAIIIGIKKERVVRWLKTDRDFNQAVMEVTKR